MRKIISTVSFLQLTVLGVRDICDEVCICLSLWLGVIMLVYRHVSALFKVVFLASLTGCGLYTPAKYVTQDDAENEGPTAAGHYEAKIAAHVACEIRSGLLQARNQLHWLEDAGTTVTQTINASDQSGVAPGITLISPLENAIFQFPKGGNVTAAQSFSFSLGVTASANATRAETIQYTFPNKQLMNLPGAFCDRKPTGVFVDGDLKIANFIRDKATISADYNLFARGAGIGGKVVDDNIFNTITEEITFVAAYGGSATPTWKLARVSANTNSNLLVGERIITNDLIVTIGPLLCPTSDLSGLSGPEKAKCKYAQKYGGPVELVASAMNQHNARVQASAISVSITGQSH